jgi:hypothetical protein
MAGNGMFDEHSSTLTEWFVLLQAQFRQTGAAMTGSLMSQTNPAAGLADARQKFRNKETIMFNRLALALLAATLISAPVMAQAPAADTAKPAEHVHKASKGHAMHMKAKKPTKEAGKAKAKKPAATTGAAKS